VLCVNTGMANQRWSCVW